MARAKKTSKTSGAAFFGDVTLENMTEAQRVAAAILNDYGDLAPSVRRILDAEISEDDRHRAMVLFQNSLTGAGDPNPNPTVAIANGRTDGGPEEG